MTGDDDPIVPLSNALIMASHIPDARVHVVRREGHFLLLDDQSRAPADVAEFLGADPLAESLIWEHARTVGRADAERQMRVDGLGALPWGALSAVVRRSLDTDLPREETAGRR